MKFKRPKRAPFILALLVLAFVFGLRLRNADFFERLERMTYDWRVRMTAGHSVSNSTNLAFVAMDDATIRAVKNGKFGYNFGLYWPRQVYGRLVEELSAQGAKAVAFDVLFDELRPEHPAVQMANGALIESDDFFARQMRQANNVLLAITPEATLPQLFSTNAHAIGEISTEKDSDGILRRARAFCDIRQWDPLIQQFASLPEISADLEGAKCLPGKIMVPQNNSTNVIEIPVDGETNFAVADFVGKLPPGRAPRAKAFTTRRVWHMGIVIAAQQLKLDLAQAQVDLPHGKIILQGGQGVERIIPVDNKGYFWVNWGLSLHGISMEKLLMQDKLRLEGKTNDLDNQYCGKLVVVGSAAQGNDLADLGATPLESYTFLVSKHWNVANSIITGQFIYRVGWFGELLLILLLSALTAWLIWQFRTLAASVLVLLAFVAYAGLTYYWFLKFRWWLPLIYPLGGIVMQYVVLLIHRVTFEEKEKRRVKSIFSRMLSPDVVTELLNTDKLKTGGVRREVTVFFADVRGFTNLTDEMQQTVADFIKVQQLDDAAAEKCVDEFAKETLETVNLYLAAVSDAVKKHDGILDKYIGDCVMAFWGEPVPNENHGQAAVRCAIDAQRTIEVLNRQRKELNVLREAENRDRAAAGLPPKPPVRALQLGTGINTGYVTVGLMGSKDLLNYTVFGREVNLASRLEGVSGSGRIIISATTYYHLLRRDSELASTCKEMFPAKLKGFQDAVRNYEVPWQENK